MSDCLLGEFLYAMDDGVTGSFPKVLIFIHRLVSFGDNLWRQPLATTFGDNLRETQGKASIRSIQVQLFTELFFFFLLLFFIHALPMTSFLFFTSFSPLTNPVHYIL